MPLGSPVWHHYPLTDKLLFIAITLNRGVHSDYSLVSLLPGVDAISRRCFVDTGGEAKRIEGYRQKKEIMRATCPYGNGFFCNGIPAYIFYRTWQLGRPNRLEPCKTCDV